MKKAIEIRRSYPDRRWLVEEINSFIPRRSCDNIDYQTYLDLIETLAYGDRLNVWSNKLEKKDFIEYIHAQKEIEEVVYDKLDVTTTNGYDIIKSNDKSISFLICLLQAVPRYGFYASMCTYLNASKDNVCIIGQLKKNFRVMPELDNNALRSVVVTDKIDNLIFTTVSQLEEIKDDLTDSSYVVVNIASNRTMTFLVVKSQSIIERYSIDSEEFLYLLNASIFGDNMPENLTVSDYDKFKDEFVINTVEPIVNKVKVSSNLELNFLLPPPNKLLDGVTKWSKSSFMGYEYAPVYVDIPLNMDNVKRLMYYHEQFDYSSMKDKNYYLPNTSIGQLGKNNNVSNNLNLDLLEINEASVLGSLQFLTSSITKVAEGAELFYKATKLVEKFVTNTPYMFRVSRDKVINDMIVPWMYRMSDYVIDNYIPQRG